MGYFKKLAAELEKPRHSRPFGSGWLSGSLSLVCGLVALAIAVILRFPDLFLTPDLAAVHELIPFRVGFQVFLIFGYILSLISLILSRTFLLSSTGFFLVVSAALIQGPATELTGQSFYFGLDFFVLKVLTVGVLFLPLERLFPHDPTQTVLRLAWREDFFYFAVSSLLVQVLNYITLAPSEFVNNNFQIDEIRYYIFTLPMFIQVFLIMIATDFMQYWIHFAFHKIPFLWRFHSIHHSTKLLDWVSGARMHFFEIAILRSFTALPMLTLGFDPGAIQVYLIIVYFYSAFIHSNIGWNMKRIERFLVTPRFHHWHHGSEDEALDINYSSHFPVFDWLFGTYHMPKTRWPAEYGVKGEEIPSGYLNQFLHPFRKKQDLPPAE